MNWHKQGGAAFPYYSPVHGAAQEGMSLRDWFAGQALAGLLAGNYRETTSFNLREVPEEAYAIADAMLAVRSAPNE